MVGHEAATTGAEAGFILIVSNTGDGLCRDRARRTGARLAQCLLSGRRQTGLLSISETTMGTVESDTGQTGRGDKLAVVDATSMARHRLKSANARRRLAGLAVVWAGAGLTAGTLRHSQDGQLQLHPQEHHQPGTGAGGFLDLRPGQADLDPAMLRSSGGLPTLPTRTGCLGQSDTAFSSDEYAALQQSDYPHQGGLTPGGQRQSDSRSRSCKLSWARNRSSNATIPRSARWPRNWQPLSRP